MNTYVAQPSMPDWDEFLQEIRPVWDSRLLTNMGPLHRKFQRQLADYLAVPHISLFANGHLALELAMEALELEGEVITTPYTFASTTHAIVRRGLTPVFCDIKPDDYTLDPARIEEMISEKTSAIIPVHVYGNLCDVEAIEKIAAKHSLKVLYDGAQSFGVRYKGRSTAEFGDATMFSFHATKVFHTIEGGALAFSDACLNERLNLLKNFGIASEEQIEAAGANAKLDEFRSAMGICNLRHLAAEIQKRKAVFERYCQHLAPVPGLRLNRLQKDTEPNYAYFPVYVDASAFGCHRDELHRVLVEHQIIARKYFYPATNHFACSQDKIVRGDTPVSDRVSQNILTLPMYADLALEEVDRICAVIRSQSAATIRLQS